MIQAMTMSIPTAADFNYDTDEIVDVIPGLPQVEIFGFVGRT